MNIILAIVPSENGDILVLSNEDSPMKNRVSLNWESREYVKELYEYDDILTLLFAFNDKGKPG